MNLRRRRAQIRNTPRTTTGSIALRLGSRRNEMRRCDISLLLDPVNSVAMPKVEQLSTCFPNAI